jgi:hypothetical protein
VVKMLVGVVLLIAAVVIGAVIAFYIGGNSEYTSCFANFGSSKAEEEADQAATQGREAGFDVTVQQVSENDLVLIFDTDKTDDVAMQDTFRRIVRQNHGSLGHPGGGCQEKQAID